MYKALKIIAVVLIAAGAIVLILGNLWSWMLVSGVGHPPAFLSRLENPDFFWVYGLISLSLGGVLFYISWQSTNGD